ncbi:hypothetical protein C8R43DRAFT_697618 [Mycena crocata]|nr:hypothetical protein C8R43DRAFT_697618 [Mycena crocata]
MSRSNWWECLRRPSRRPPLKPRGGRPCSPLRPESAHPLKSRRLSRPGRLRRPSPRQRSRAHQEDRQRRHKSARRPQLEHKGTRLSARPIPRRARRPGLGGSRLVRRRWVPCLIFLSLPLFFPLFSSLSFFFPLPCHLWCADSSGCESVAYGVECVGRHDVI